MRRTLALLTIPVLALTVGCSSSSRSSAPAARTPMFTSITSASNGAWTTPASQTVNSSSPPGPVAYTARPAQPTGPVNPAPTNGWEQPPVLDEMPQAPPVDIPAEPTWTAPAPAPDLPPVEPGDFPAPMPDNPVDPIR